MITIQQCRAARGLLGWTQQDLANISSLSKTAINNFEKGHSDIKQDSLMAIQKSFETSGIEFLHNNGLRQKTEAVKILRGETLLKDITEEILSAPLSTEQEILFVSSPDESYGQNCSNFKKHIAQLEKSPAKLRMLCCESDQLHPAHTRTLSPKKLLVSGSFCIFGQKTILRPWKQDIAIIIESEATNIAERRRFEALWEMAEDAILSNRQNQMTGNS